MTTINIYYGGRGLIDDPSIYVMDKLTTVFDELNVNVKRYNLYEDKHGISVLPKTLKEADAVIITASVEWFGIGGLLQQFLDACWLYGDKDAIRRLYMMPVVLSTTYGEKEAYQTLTKAWEILGGTPCDGICAYVSSSVDFETNNDYGMLIEKKAENFYRTFTKKMVTFPSSSNAVVETSQAVKPMTLTPQESEELSMYVSDDNYVKRQKEDIEELTQLFKNLMDDDTDTSTSDKDTELDTASLFANILNKNGDDDKYINAFMSLKVEQYVDLGTHGMFICSVTEARVMNDLDTMTYTYYQKNVKPKPETDGKKGFVCKVCGYIYEGDELPDDFICPLCKHGAADFEPIG